ncbi:MAG: hypothetical protein WA939_19280 [Nodosilinea sp.]
MFCQSTRAKRHLLDIIEQQIFEAEEANYTDDSATKTEIEAVKAEETFGATLATKILELFASSQGHRPCAPTGNLLAQKPPSGFSQGRFLQNSKFFGVNNSRSY